MAVTIVDQPNTLSPLANGFKFVLNLPDSGDNENVKQGVYQLHDSSGLIKEMGVFRPQGGGDVAIDFKEDIKGKVFAKMPSFGVNGVQNDNTILKTFKILYGEKNIDTVNRVVTTDTSFSSDFKVIAAANNVINSFFIEDETQKILSLRPKNYNMIRNSHDWIWLYGSGSVTYKFYSESGLIGSPLVVSAPYEVNIIPLNLSSFLIFSKISKPFIPGNIRSTMITSGIRLSNELSAPSPSLTWTRSNPEETIFLARIVPISLSSSIQSNFFLSLDGILGSLAMADDP
jgi:hypothetical protein